MVSPRQTWPGSMFANSNALPLLQQQIHGSQLIPTTGTYPKGWRAGGWHSGVKKQKELPFPPKDLAIIASDARFPVTASAVFTLNAFAAAPVKVSKEVIGKQRGTGLRAVVVNSGCANACTGEQGLQDAWRMSAVVDAALSKGDAASSKNHPETIVMSTGVIGQHLDMDKIVKGIEELAPNLEESHDGWLGAAEGIMTTDTFPKLRSQEFKTYRMAGWCKGAGMIHPNMATMLSAVFTDAKLSKKALDAATKYAADRSFNAISIDGDTSTNDTFAVLANGASASATLIDDISSPEFLEFRDNLTSFAADLAKLIVRDGEGATKFVEIRIKGAKTFVDARKVSSTIATSPLVKTALYGKDANWGRIICAVGYSEIAGLNPDKVSLHVSSSSAANGSNESIHLFKDGAPYESDEDKAARILENEDLLLSVDLGMGKEEATMYTCDFSHDYISINADYRS
ncbi:ArgJ family protein [Fimicolochytrium jonesii]|uniref:ArgJ family protein n=1 Tax=Fimicolochytrium jonesii TaxID=1396493 RepID=UPI0022FF1125|nr:ArgJ family protein [Fimicolochytrium jonesii]KAI8819339.1 ArgJ family protein [Fimicolochytrium jonesii]